MGNRKNNLFCVAFFLNLVIGLGLICFIITHHHVLRPHTTHPHMWPSYVRHP